MDTRVESGPTREKQKNKTAVLTFVGEQKYVGQNLSEKKSVSEVN